MMNNDQTATGLINVLISSIFEH